MILAQLRDYLRTRGQASLRDLALHCDADPDAVRGMLEHWVRRGQVSQQALTGACGGGCTRCDQAAVEIYVWREPGVDSCPPAQPLVSQPFIRGLGCAR